MSGAGGGLLKVEEREKVSEGEKEKGKEKEAASELNVPWIPNFVTPEKKQVLKSDNLQEDPSLAFTLHSRLMLPKDISTPLSPKAALNDYYFYVGRVSEFFSFVHFLYVCYLFPSENDISHTGDTIYHGCAMLPHRA